MLRAIDKWLPGYLASVWRRPRGWQGRRHLLLCVCDHFEPRGCDVGTDGTVSGGRSVAEAARETKAWSAAYEAGARQHSDADGRPPRHTFFYPAEEYAPECLASLTALTRRGYGEVEIHLHHRNDSEPALRQRLSLFRDTLHREHGLLGTDATGRVRYGFVHGNWALCNARPDGDWCGVNNELGILAATGCYADFTFPSAPSPTQPRMVNALWRAVDTGRPRAADCGRRVEVIDGVRSGAVATGSLEASADKAALMLISGPLALDWQRRKWGIVPRLENAELSGVNPPGVGRCRLWVRQAIGVRGRPDWVFVKLHTHGMVPRNRDMLLGKPMQAFHGELQRRWNDGDRWQLHYVTAREMYNLARAAEEGRSGTIAELRDYEVAPPGLR